MAAYEFIFALACAALAMSILYAALALSRPSPVARRVPRAQVLYRDRPCRSIELYARPGGRAAATPCCRSVQIGNILVLPNAARLAYLVEAIEYVGRYGATARFRTMSTDDVLESGLLHVPDIAFALKFQTERNTALVNGRCTVGGSTELGSYDLRRNILERCKPQHYIRAIDDKCHFGDCVGINRGILHAANVLSIANPSFRGVCLWTHSCDPSKSPRCIRIKSQFEYLECRILDGETRGKLIFLENNRLSKNDVTIDIVGHRLYTGGLKGLDDRGPAQRAAGRKVAQEQLLQRIVEIKVALRPRTICEFHFNASAAPLA